VAHEDSQARKYLTEALSRAGFATVACGDIRILLERRRTAGHSFAILKSGDRVMDTLRAVREQGNTIPVILLSGAETPSTADSDVGNVAHLSAPFTVKTLELAIARLDHFDSTGTPPLPEPRGSDAV
jgi:DNA-binding response OmpR family regulator